MKKPILLTLSLFFICFYGVKGQTPKPDTTKPKYQYFAVIPVGDIKGIAASLEDYARIIMYDPNKTDAEKVSVSKGIDMYLKQLPNRVKLDSVKVQPKAKP